MFSRIKAEHRLWHRGADVFNVLERKVFLFRWFGSHVVSVFLLFSVYSETLSRELRDVDV